MPDIEAQSAATKANQRQPAVAFVHRLTGARFSTGAVMLFERLWPVLLPLLIVISLFASFAWFGLFRIMPDWLRLSALALMFAVALAALYPLRWFSRPKRREIDRRIERHNELQHTPILAQADRLAGETDGFAEALWREHQKRMADRLDNLSGDLPRTRIPERDPWGFRAAAALLLVTAFGFSFGPLGGELSDAIYGRPAVPPVPPRVDAWVTPPSYTGRAPVFLTADANRGMPMFEVPVGSDVTLRVTGGEGSEALAFAPAPGGLQTIEPEVATQTAAQQSAGVRNFTGKLNSDGTLTLSIGATPLMQWVFRVIPDAAPVISYLGEPKRAVNGTLELTYSIKDDYGPASARAEFDLVEPQDAKARPLFEKPDMPLSLPRRTAKDGAAKTSRDLTEHVWAGAEVWATLSATDGAGQVAQSETRTFRMPERPFSNPLARAVIEQRRILALDANRKARVLDLMDGVMLRPEDTIAVPAHWLALSSARTRLKLATSDEDLRGVVKYLWEIALSIEDGALSAAERQLRQAQEALKNALENGASDEEIEKLMSELRKAMQEYLREFAERAQQNPNMGQQAPQQNGQELRQSDIDRMLDQIEQLAKSGSKDKAQELLSQLQEMMNNLQAGRQQQGQGQQSQMRQQMDKLGDLMRRQQQMMNDTHRLDQMQRGENREQQPGEGEQQGQNGEGQQGEQGQQGQRGGMSEQEMAEALRGMQQGQGQLRNELGELMQGLEGMGIQPGKGFGEAGEAMGDAQGEEAVGEQSRALEALRKGAQDMMQQMQQAMQGEQGGGEEGGRQQNADRDPLGRPRATTGPDFGDTVKVPDEIDVQRAREILDAIRRRLGNALSPEIERDYLERLLEMQ